MPRPRSLLLLALATFAAARLCAASEPLDTLLPLDSEIQRILDDRVVTYRDSIGLVVGVITPQSRKIFARGTYDVGDDLKVDGDTIFEIGSVTKIFTALALADAAHKGEISLTEPASKYLPATTTLPKRGRPITLLDLATHTSGLPKSVSNVRITDVNNPNKDVSEEQLESFLARYQLTRDVGSAYEFSNVGYDLLGIALSYHSKLAFGDLLRARIFDPLHMNSTRFEVPVDAKDRLTVGHDAHLQTVQSTELPELLGPDSLRSTANDLLNFLAANMGYAKSPLSAAMADMLKERRPTGYPERQAAIGWHIVTLHDTEMVWQSGQNAGYRAFIGFVPKTRIGVVVLSNSANTVDDIGEHLLDPKTPLKKLYREVAVNSGLFDNYVGEYAANQRVLLIVSHDGDRLFIEPFGQPRAELFAESDEQYFLRDVDAQVTFQTDGSGFAQSVTLIQDGKIISAKRIR